MNRVMAEGSLYDPDLAALAIKQSWGDLVEAAFLLRAYRTTLPRLYYSQPINTDHMHLQRRISAIFFKEAPGGQKLGPTFDYVHRLLDFKLAAETNEFPPPTVEKAGPQRTHPPHPNHPHRSKPDQQDFLPSYPTASKPILNHPNPPTHLPTYPPTQPSPFDLTRQPLSTPASRDARLQKNLARADRGIFALQWPTPPSGAMAITIPLRGKFAMGDVEVVICPEELGFEVAIADITVTEVQMVNQFKGNKQIPTPVYPGVRPHLWLQRAQGHGHGADRSGTAGEGSERIH